MENSGIILKTFTYDAFIFTSTADWKVYNSPVSVVLGKVHPLVYRD